MIAIIFLVFSSLSCTSDDAVNTVETPDAVSEDFCGDLGGDKTLDQVLACQSIQQKLNFGECKTWLECTQILELDLIQSETTQNPVVEVPKTPVDPVIEVPKTLVDTEFTRAAERIIEIEDRRRTLVSEYELLGHPLWTMGGESLAFGQNDGQENLASLKLELAMLDVPDELQAVKGGLLAVYDLEIWSSYLDDDCVNIECSPRQSAFSEVTELNIQEYAGTAVRSRTITKSPWFEAQKQRRTLYALLNTELLDKGVDVTVSPWNSISLNVSCRNGMAIHCDTSS